MVKLQEVTGSPLLAVTGLILTHFMGKTKVVDLAIRQFLTGRRFSLILMKLPSNSSRTSHIHESDKDVHTVYNWLDHQGPPARTEG